MENTRFKATTRLILLGVALTVVSTTIVGCGLVLAAGAGAGAGYVAAEETDGDGRHAFEADE